MTEIRAEISGSVWKVTAAVGDQVTEGQTIAILESMKMEIPVESPVSGTLAELRVAPEDRVAEGEIIAVVR
jgi:acetyl-CoA carboxylase biotin carboxyl carrier protein